MSSQSPDRTESSEQIRSKGLATAVNDTVDGTAHLIATYDSETFTTHHTEDGFENISVPQSYFELDFFEHRMLLDSLFTEATQVESRTLALDNRQLVTMYDGTEAVLTIVDDSERIEPLLETLRTLKGEWKSR